MYPNPALLRCLVFAVVGLGLTSARFSEAEAPESQLATPSEWPTATSIHRAKGQRQVLLFVNPYAFESRSAIYRAVELSAQSGAGCTVCLVGPRDAPTEWYDTPLAWTATRNGLAVHRDAGGVEAGNFSAESSGVCVAYDARGRLCYFGDLDAQPSGESYDAGVKAALDALSHIRANQDSLTVRPTTGRALLED